LAFRRAYDALQERFDGRKADVEYLRILHLAASTMQADVEAVLVELLDGGESFDAGTVKDRVQPAKPDVPELEPHVVSLGEYDALHAGVSRDLAQASAGVAR
jgi:hypothetical protein